MNTTNDTEFLSQHAKLKPKDHHLMSHNIDNMRCGADALIDESLLSLMTDENSKIMSKYVYTDQLATMIKKKFVFGSFDSSMYVLSVFLQLNKVTSTD